MTPEDRAFLDKAFEEAFGHIEDPNKVMTQALDMIKDVNRTEAMVQTALEVIDKSCDDPDCARNAEKLGGVQTLLDLLAAYPSPIKTRTLEILALFLSNNPNIQEAGVKRGALPIFSTIVRDAPVGSEERLKAFRAVVALVRNYEAFEQKFFEEEDGFSMVLSCMALEEDPRTQEKAVSFIQNLTANGRFKDKEDAVRISSALSALLGTDGNGIQYRETLAQCSSALVQAFPESCIAILRPAVEARIQALKSAPDEGTEPELETLQECAAAFAA